MVVVPRPSVEHERTLVPRVCGGCDSWDWDGAGRKPPSFQEPCSFILPRAPAFSSRTQAASASSVMVWSQHVSSLDASHAPMDHSSS